MDQQEEEVTLAPSNAPVDDVEAAPVGPPLTPGEGGEILVRPENDPTDPANDPFNASHEDYQRKAVRREAD